MTARDTEMTPVSATLATEIEVAEMVPSLWDLFAELSGTVGLADGAPDLSVPGRLAVEGVTSAGRLLLIVEERPASAVESPAVRVSLHSTAGEQAEAVHTELVEVAAARLAPHQAVWRTRFPAESWSEHGLLPVTTVETAQLETTRIEITGRSVDAWALLMELARLAGLDEAVPPRLSPDTTEIASVEVSGVTWAGLQARVVVEPTAGGGLAATLTSTGGDDEDIADLHCVVLDEVAVWLDERPVVWRWTTDRCAPEAWHCGWRLTTGRHQRPEPARPAAAWRRWTALAVDWPVSVVSTVLNTLAMWGVLLHPLGRGRIGTGWVADLLWTTGRPAHAAVLVAAAFLARRAADIVAVVLDPAAVEPRGWPSRWWARLAAVLVGTAPALLLGTAVVLLGGGWLS
jgi:hypothetical protein